MNYADKAEQLRAARLEKEKLEKERLAKEQQDAVEKKRKGAELAKQKAEELLPIFKQFDGRKICGGSVSLEAVLKHQAGVCAWVRLKAGTVGSSALDRYTPNQDLYSAHYDYEGGYYRLNKIQPKTPGGTIIVGTYKSIDELMNAVAQEISML